MGADTMKRVIFRQNETNRRRLPPSPDGFGATGQAALIFGVAPPCAWWRCSCSATCRFRARRSWIRPPMSDGRARWSTTDPSGRCTRACARLSDLHVGDPLRLREFADGGAHRAVDPGRDRLRADRAGGVADAHASRVPARRTAAGCLRPADLHRYRTSSPRACSSSC